MGREVGNLVGKYVGLVGRNVGILVGATDGSKEGATLGGVDGIGLGPTEGFAAKSSVKKYTYIYCALIKYVLIIYNQKESKKAS